MNGGIESANLLDQLLTNELVKDTLAMLVCARVPLCALKHCLSQPPDAFCQVVDFSRPWTALESLEKWSDKLVELVGRIDPEVLEQLRKSRVEAYQTCVSLAPKLFVISNIPGVPVGIPNQSLSLKALKRKRKKKLKKQ